MANLFTITKGSKNIFTFTIKQTGSTLPMTLVGTDTFTARLVRLSDDVPAFTNKALTLPANPANYANGQVQLTILAAETDALVSSKGTVADRYYLIPTYKLIIDCVTTNNGEFITKVDSVYVD